MGGATDNSSINTNDVHIWGNFRGAKHSCLNPVALRKAKIANNFGLSECNRVKPKYIWHTYMLMECLVANFSFTDRLPAGDSLVDSWSNLRMFSSITILLLHLGHCSIGEDVLVF